MKAILKYNLPEEEKEFLRASQATSLALALWDFKQTLRDIDKYDKEYDIELIRDTLSNTLEWHGINLDNLIQ